MPEIIPKQALPPRACKHGQSYTVEYRVWRGLVNRCTRPTDPAWDNYGGRGIRVCDEWREDFFTFLADMGRRPSPGHEIDRRDNNGGYDRHNCRWVSRQINSINRRSTRFVTFRGERVCLADACRMADLPYDVVNHRINGPAKWSVDRALNTAVRAKAAKGQAKVRHQPMTNKTGFPGVKARRNGFTASIMILSRMRYSKQFSTAKEAHQWYQEMLQMRQSSRVTT